MSNLKHDTGKPRFLKLLFVVLMMSVGLNLLLGCGKSNKGQVVGPTPECKEDCDEGKKPYSDELWETAIGKIEMYGTNYLTLGLDLYEVGAPVGKQGINPSPVGGAIEAEGSLWINNVWLFCNYYQSYQVPAGEYKITKNLQVGQKTTNGFQGNVLEVKKGSTSLKLFLGDMWIIPYSYGQTVKDPAGYTYNNFLFGRIYIEDGNRCSYDGTVSAGFNF